MRSVAYARRYPLFASGADDGTVCVFHGMVYDDLSKNPLIVPVRVLRCDSTDKNFGVNDVAFHPIQPWLVSAGTDGVARLFVNVG